MADPIQLQFGQVNSDRLENDLISSETASCGQNGNFNPSPAQPANSNSTNNQHHSSLKSDFNTDVLRIIGQHLASVGLKKTVEQLLLESGLNNLDHLIAIKLQQHILAGDWDQVVKAIHQIISDSETRENLVSKNRMLLLVAEQKFLELIEDNQHVTALKCLRVEITPLIENSVKLAQLDGSICTASATTTANNNNDNNSNSSTSLNPQTIPDFSQNPQLVIKRVQQLTSLLMCKTLDEVKLKANWPGKGPVSRQRLIENIQRYISPSIMLPPRRLTTLLSQAAQLQCEKCTLHIPNLSEKETNPESAGDKNGTMTNPNFTNNNTNAAITTTLTTTNEINYGNSKFCSNLANYNVDLKIDHRCSAKEFPTQPRQELNHHRAEVWFCKFSNDGKKLATAGLGGKIKIWDVDPTTKLLSERATLDCNGHSIICLSWSPNDVYLLACGGEDRPDLWVWNILKEDLHNLISQTEDESTTTCSWHLSGLKFAAASMKGNFNIYDIDGHRKGSREGVRVQCLSFLNKDPNFILAADSLHRIKSYAIKNMSLESDEEDILEERVPIISFTIDREDKYIAVNLVDQGIHLWDLQAKTLLKMFPGVCQRDFTIYSSFSNTQPTTFLASGSEDGKVYIYNINKDKPVAILHGHIKCVNCVTWNPRYSELLVSVSDDGSVKLWGPQLEIMITDHNYQPN